MLRFPDKVAVVGVPGTGKTTVCRLVSREIDHQYINYGDLMLEIAIDMGAASTREVLFNLPLKDQQLIWLEAARRVRSAERVLVDLHGVDQSPLGYIISLPFEFIKPDLIIILEADARTVEERRRRDSRKRIQDTEESLMDHIEMLRVSMFVCSALTGSVIHILQNYDARKTADHIIKLINMY